ncbi:hypothetical protein [Aneurinibacillus aneurinilyticus]|uniref:Uncharacterized protein n=1 Tax=Aneurinibacillus aneurinilyticus ATCC 12856 TaxID=649747 RepID=U1YJF9_ANEAE|nr:hypothetical protein [Aneurinibacillus aneurinilyticus]ERI10921.1 hypothetical protein HMPREF0083_00970 [Aneurinibacillus aneurinilyticus ATCC 12856]
MLAFLLSEPLAHFTDKSDVTEQLTVSFAGYSDTFILGFIISIHCGYGVPIFEKKTKEKQTN